VANLRYFECDILEDMFMSTEWKMVHDESPRADVTVEFFCHATKGMLFVRNEQGIEITVHADAESALNGQDEFAVAKICYGEYTFMDTVYGNLRLDGFLDKAHAADSYDPLRCDHSGISCEERFHQVQVWLENEEADECEWCQFWFKKEAVNV